MKRKPDVVVPLNNQRTFPKIPGAGTIDKYVVTGFMGLIPADDNSFIELNNEPWFDPLDPKLVDMFSADKVVAKHPYFGGAITTISDKHYGTTSLWFAILMFNGFTHQDEIPRGFELLIPSLQTTALRTYRENNRKGQRTTI